jgi:hypothetical protein
VATENCGKLFINLTMKPSNNHGEENMLFSYINKDEINEMAHC